MKKRKGKKRRNDQIELTSERLLFSFTEGYIIFVDDSTYIMYPSKSRRNKKLINGDAINCIELGVCSLEDKKLRFEILSPNLPNELDSISIFDKSIQSEDTFNRGIISNGLVENQTADHVSFNKVIFKNVIFNNVLFKYLDLVDVRFENCDLSNMDLSESVLHKVEMVNCKMVGTNMSESALRNVLFDNCNGSYALFRFLDCKQVNFNNSALCNADFYKAKLLKVGFNESNLQQTGMSGAKLKGIDLSSCKIDGLGVAVDDLSGCIVSPEQVISFSNLLGLIIKR